MQRRVIAAVAAVVLALLGGFALYTYVQGADRRAMAGLEVQNVLVVREAVAKGTAASALKDAVEVRSLPKAAVATGAVTDLGALAGRVATVDLAVGEQVLDSRFADPAAIVAAGTVAVPEGMEQVSIVLEPQRVIGANLRAGDTVGLIASFTMEQGDGGDAVQTTHLMLEKVLVTRAQGASPAAPSGQGSSNGTNAQQAEETPGGAVMVTLAVSASDAEKVVFAAEYGKLWLTLQGPKSDQDGVRMVTAGNIFE